MYETRVVRVFGVFAIALALLAVRAFVLQVANRAAVLEEHDKRVHGRFVLAPRRGEIQWSDGAPMAWNEPEFTVDIDLASYFATRFRCDGCAAVVRRNSVPSACKDCGGGAFTRAPMPDARALAQLLGVTDTALGEALVRAAEKREAHPEFRTFELLSRVSRDAAVAVALAARSFPGVSVRSRAGRRGDPLAASVAGATRPAWPEDLVELRDDPGRKVRGERVYSAAEVFSMRFGRSGLEASFDEELRGDPGRAHRVRRPSTGAAETAVDLPVVDGVTLRTTLRRSVQELANSIVSRASGAAAAVVVDVRDGSVAAIASKSNDGYHHAVVAMRPGSVFKLVTALALLESGVGADDSVRCDRVGHLPSGKAYVCDGTHGEISLRSAFAQSCNAYFGAMAERAGPAAMRRAAEELGLDENPTLELRGSAAGLDPSWGAGSRWYPADMGRIGIGQGKALVSPLQVAVAYARVAAAGRPLVPHLVAGAPATERPAAPGLVRFAPLLASCAREVVTSGTGRKIRELDLVEAAGKTGTGDIVAGARVNNAWFVAYAPASAPRYAVAVVFEKVEEHGADIAGLPAAQLLAEALR